jgi:hypothetical protein
MNKAEFYIFFFPAIHVICIEDYEVCLMIAHSGLPEASSLTLTTGQISPGTGSFGNFTRDSI